MDHFFEFIMNHWILVSLLLVTGGLILWQENYSSQATEHLSPQNAILLINDKKAVVLDIREPDDFQKGHIVDARSLQPADFNQPKLQKVIKKKPVIIVCSRGIQAKELAYKWKKEGMQDVHVLAGGMDAWYAEGLPVVK